MYDDIEERLREWLGEYLQMSGRHPDHSGMLNCPNPTHPDKTPSAKYNRDNNNIYCFGCHETIDIFDLIGWDYGLTSFPDKKKKAAELFGMQLSGGAGMIRNPRKSQKITTDEQKIDYTAYFAECHARINETNYPASRGLGADVLERFNIGYDPAWRHPKRPKDQPLPFLIIPTSQYSYTARYTGSEKIKDPKMKVGKLHIIGLEALEQSDPTFIVEGEIDALSLWEIGIPAVALGTTNKAKDLVEYMREQPPKAAVVLALDNDDPGRTAQADIKKALNEAGIYSFSADTAAIYDGEKDANAALVKSREAFQKAAEAAQGDAKNAFIEWKDRERIEYEQTSAVKDIDNFLDNILQGQNTPVVSTGFTSLDHLLDGGLYEGLYAVGAISSLGKTTLCMQIADQIAAQGQDVLIFSLEMSRRELIAKSISRQTYILTIEKNGKNRYMKTARDILAGERYQYYTAGDWDIIQAATDRYKEIASNIYFIDGLGQIGTDEIRERVARHINMTGSRPVVFIDYLQIMKPADIKATDKQNTDKAVFELKRLSRDYKLPVVAISSINRQNYNKEIDLQAFKESGAIEYSSDVLIGLQFEGTGKNDIDIKEAKRDPTRKIEVVVLKNRNGRTGKPDTAYTYFPAYNYFKEG